MLSLYTKSHCDKCEDIKKRLQDKGVEFQEMNSEDKEVMKKLVELLKNAGIKNPMLPVLALDDGSVISNEMGLYRELRQREIL